MSSSGGSRLGLIRCEHCGRQFNPHSGARHIPWCAKQNSEQRKHKLSAEKRQALERYKWRINYKPSNQLAGSGRPVAGGHEQQPLGGRKKSSLNSASLSSYSASSTNSIGTNSLLSSSGGQPPAGTRSSPSTKPKLARSISSVSLSKRPARAANLGESSGASAKQAALLRQRAKSHSDILSVSEIVESLARRVEEIFAQNEILLAQMGRRAERLPSGALRSDSEEDSFPSRAPVCHHCKSDCLERANYCHQCGCKVQLRSSSRTLPSPVGSS